MKTIRSNVAAETEILPAPPDGLAAFSRVEMLITLCVLILLAAVALPALANPRQRSQRVQCANNLRQIFVAAQWWGHDHRDRVPWETPVIEGGTMAHTLASNPWLHFSWMSNELTTPVVLLCPSDSGRPARDFTGDPAGGYLHPNFANRATSYFLSHSLNSLPNGLMAGDRNLNHDGVSSGCANFNTTFALFHPGSVPANFSWNTNLHALAGNIMRLDGQVRQFSNNELRADIQSMPLNDSGITHFIPPR